MIITGKDIDLGLLPITHHAELNSGKYISIGCMVSKHPDTGIPNVGVYRHEVKGKDKLGCMVNPANHGAYIARRSAELGKTMEVAIFIGHHPAVVLGAMTRGDINLNELEIMGGLLGEPLEVVRGETVDLPVPAHAEVVIEGVIDPRNMVTDGPFAEYLGYYGEGNKPCYLIDVTAITMRRDAIYHDLDPAHREHVLSCVLGLESGAYDAVKRVVPTVQAVHIFPSASSFVFAGVCIRKRVPGEGVLAGMMAIGDPAIKGALVVDEDIDIFNEQEALWAAGTRVVADQDIHTMPRILGAHLDPTTYDETRLKRGPMLTKVVIDATKPVGLPFSTRITPPKDLWESMKLADYVK
ncbi:MAG: UbiD family decarboxylase [Chloroflexi bacterium]|nr:UbiD family decarboxylase [Chloroflexota bacterium]